MWGSLRHGGKGRTGETNFGMGRGPNDVVEEWTRTDKVGNKGISPRFLVKGDGHYAHQVDVTFRVKVL